MKIGLLQVFIQGISMGGPWFSTVAFHQRYYPWFNRVVLLLIGCLVLEPYSNMRSYVRQHVI